MARVIRQVDVVLQNHTSELLTMESALNIQGEWLPTGTPRIGAIIPKQGAAKWTSVSMVDGVSAQAFIRLGSTKGYIDIRWNLPRSADQFEREVIAPEGLHPAIVLSGPNLDFRVMLVTLTAPALEANARALHRA